MSLSQGFEGITIFNPTNGTRQGQESDMDLCYDGECAPNKVYGFCGCSDWESLDLSQQVLVECVKALGVLVGEHNSVKAIQQAIDNINVDDFDGDCRVKTIGRMDSRPYEGVG